MAAVAAASPYEGSVRDVVDQLARTLTQQGDGHGGAQGRGVERACPLMGVEHRFAVGGEHTGAQGEVSVAWAVA